MGLTFLPAPPDLADWIVSFWQLEGAAIKDPSLVGQRVLPDGFPELIVHLQTPYQRRQRGQLHQDPKAFVFGQLCEPIELHSDQSVLAIGARLHPAALAQLASLPGHEFHQGPIPLRDLWGAEGRALERRMRASASTSGALELLVSTLRRLRQRKPSTSRQQLAVHATAWIHQTQGRGSIHNLSNYLGYSRRHIERLFNENLGISPKFFARLHRFQALQRTIASVSDLDWLTLAIDSGYADQAHMIREFREFSGQTPLEFVSSNHPLAEAFVLG